jgi:hypothetical protein
MKRKTGIYTVSNKCIHMNKHTPEQFNNFKNIFIDDVFIEKEEFLSLFGDDDLCDIIEESVPIVLSIKYECHKVCDADPNIIHDAIDMKGKLIDTDEIIIDHWSPELHKFFPQQTRLEIVTLLNIWYIDKFPIPIPIEVLYEICNSL